MLLHTNWIAFRTILFKEIRRFTRIWIQTIVPPVINSVLYMVIFGGLIGRRIGEINGTEYLAFIVPGIIMMTVITSSYANVVSSFFSNKFHRSIEEMLVSPVHNAVILGGFVAGGVCRGLAVGFAVSVVSLFFTSIEINSLLVTFAIMLLTSVLFAIAGFINAVFARNFDDISIIPNFVLTPLTYLGGIFYSIQMLPEFWQGVSMLNPVLYMINGFRHGIFGQSDISIGLAFTVICSFILCFGSWALWLLNRGVGIRQ